MEYKEKPQSVDEIAQRVDSLPGLIENDVTKMFEEILDYAQVACPTKDTYKVLRSKILRIGNNTIRKINRRFESLPYKE